MPANDCILWWGYVNPEGYGRSGNKQAHRLVWEECVGEIPLGWDVHHVCENKACVNPEHLCCLSHRAHIALHGDLTRGRATRNARWRARTHCKHGHAFTPENTYYRRDNGYRQCRACHRRDTQLRSASR